MTLTTAWQVPPTGSRPRAGLARTMLAILMPIGPLAIAVVRGILPYNTTDSKHSDCRESRCSPRHPDDRHPGARPHPPARSSAPTPPTACRAANAASVMTAIGMMCSADSARICPPSRHGHPLASP